MSLFDMLPPEVLNIVLEACEFGILKNVRTLNNALHDLVTPMIFSDVWLGLFDYSIDNLQAIANSTHLAPLVKNVFVCGGWMRAMSFEQWQRYLDVPGLRAYETSKTWSSYDRMPQFNKRKSEESKSARRGGLTDAELARHWFLYRDLAEQQRSWLKLPKRRDQLRKSLAELSNIKHIELRSPMAQFEGPKPDPIWLDLWSQTLILTSWHPERHRQDNLVALLSLLGCYQLSKRRPPAQSLRLTVWDTMLAEYFTGQWKPEFCKDLHVVTPFTRVTSLELRLVLNGEEDGDKRTQTAITGVARWLRAAPQLKKLSIDVNGDFDYWSRSMKDITLPKLEQLDVSLESDEEDLAGWLGKHSRTLQYLTLGYLRIYGGSSESLITRIPSLLPELRTVRVTGPMHSPDLYPVNPRRCDFNWMIEQTSWQAEYAAFAVKGMDCPTMDPAIWFESHTDEFAGTSSYLDKLALMDDIESGKIDPGQNTGGADDASTRRARDDADVPDWNWEDELPSDCSTIEEDWEDHPRNLC